MYSIDRSLFHITAMCRSGESHAPPCNNIPLNEPDFGMAEEK